MKLYIYILISAGVSFLLRVLPLTLIKGRIENKFIRSFLYYVPYVTLSVMTFPAIVNATGSPIVGTISLVCGVISAWFNLGLLPTAGICCIVAFLAQMIIK